MFFKKPTWSQILNRCNTIVMIISLLSLAAVLFIDCSRKTEVSQNVQTDIPQKIVSLSPASTEILFAVGAESQIAAVSQFTDYPPEATKLPVVGGFDGKTLSIEKILSFNPDFVYMTNGMHNFLIDQLNQYGIKYYLSTANSVADVKNEIIEIGKITGHEENAREVIDKIEKTISECTEKAQKASAVVAAVNTSTTDKITTTDNSHSEISVYYEVWNSPYMSAGKTSFINDIITIAGGKNVFDDIDSPYPIVSEETIILRQPQVIFVPATAGITVDSVATRIGWENLPAVKNKKIFVIDDNLITRPGARIGESVKTIYNYINQ